MGRRAVGCRRRGRPDPVHRRPALSREPSPRLGSRLGAALGARPALLDGELAVLDGRETYMVYDVLHLDGRPLLGVPYRERREILDGLALSGPRWQTAPWFPGDGDAVRAAAGEQGLPGVVAKRLDSPYEPGEESGAWRFVPS